MADLTPKAQFIADIMIAAHKAIVGGVDVTEVQRLTSDFAADLGDRAISEAASKSRRTRGQSDGE